MSRTAAELLPLFVTEAFDPAAPVVTVPMAIVAAAPAGPVAPAEPAGPVSPAAPAGPVIADRATMFVQVEPPT
jgi:hypothetical protein